MESGSKSRFSIIRKNHGRRQRRHRHEGYWYDLLQCRQCSSCVTVVESVQVFNISHFLEMSWNCGLGCSIFVISEKGGALQSKRSRSIVLTFGVHWFSFPHPKQLWKYRRTNLTLNQYWRTSNWPSHLPVASAEQYEYIQAASTSKSTVQGLSL